MKRLFALILLTALILCGCSVEETVSAGAEALLRSVAENEELQTWIEEHPLDELAQDALTTLTEKFPVLEKLTNTDNLKQLLKTTGLDLVKEYINSTDPETQEKANTLGAIIKILQPELEDEVNTVLGE